MLAVLALLLLALPAPAAERAHTAGPGVQVLAPMRIAGLDRERLVRVYLPPGYATSHRRYPVLYMHDGQNLFDDATSFVGEWGVDEAMDQLAREGIELIVVGIDHGNESRIAELSAWPNPKYGDKAEGREYMRFIVGQVKPYVDGHFRTRPGRADTGILGSSLGGLISHYAAFAHADVFGRIGVFSPSYWFAPAVYELSAARPLPRGTRMYLVAGDKEGDEPARVVADTVRMEARLRREQPGLRLRALIRPGAGHDERAWREEFPRAVRFLFGRD
jgi:predicted alpha/beta superfamily hydrolase